MFEKLQEIYQVDWHIFMADIEAWLAQRSPYGDLGPDMSAGAFSYPPTALSWLALFVPLGGLGFYLWTMLEVAGWWLLMRKEHRAQLSLIIWAPMVLHLVEG